MRITALLTATAVAAGQAAPAGRWSPLTRPPSAIHFGVHRHGTVTRRTITVRNDGTAAWAAGRLKVYPKRPLT